MISLREFGKFSNLAMQTTSFRIKRLLFLTKTKKKPTLLVLLKHCNYLPLSTFDKGVCETAWKGCACL